ncbi:MAG: amidohydrolase family protein [Verrucomicrobiota bacterium]|nr:amidohydrolase family protein [Verrucomicrobiota bacterium]
MKKLIVPLLAAVIAAGCVTSKKSASIPIIDTHIHLYDTTRPEGVPWPPETDKVLYKPILTKDFDRVSDENGVNATVIVEASKWIPDNQWILDLVKHDPERYIGLVGSLEIGTPDFKKHLFQLSKDNRYVGIRMRERPGGDSFFENKAVWADLRLLADMDQTLDVLMFQYSIEDVDMVAKRLPNLKILMNHVAGADIEGKSADTEWVADVQKVAKNPNVYCKISGLFQQSHRQPSPKDVLFYKSELDVLWNAFGEERLIYGSNWPVTMRGGTYAEYLAVVKAYFADKPRSAQEKYFYRNALKFYGLPSLKR